MTTVPHPQLVLLRHGPTAWSVTGQHTGRSDIPLTDDGERQAAAAGEFLRQHAERRGRGFDVVLTSPLRRARRTAELVGYPDADVDPDLAEWDYGPVDGRTAVDVGAQLGREWLIFRDGVNVVLAPGERPGETLAEVAARTRAVVERVEPTLHDGGDVLLVAHGHLLRILTTTWLGLDPTVAARLELGTAAVCLLGHGHGLRTVECWNLTREA